jgi:hypothetical protein
VGLRAPAGISPALLGAAGGVAQLDANSRLSPTQQYLEVIADPSVPNGTTNNTSYLTTLNALAISRGAVLRIPKGTAGSWVISEWVLPSGSKIDARGATLTRPSATQKPLVTNTSRKLATPGSTRDSDITITGGVWDRADVTGITHDPDAHTFYFTYVDRLSIRDLEMRSQGPRTGGIYAIAMYACADVSCNNIVGNVTSAIIQGAQCSKVHVQRVTGISGDDSVAFMPRDPYLEIGALVPTDCYQIVVDGVYTKSYRNGTKILSGKTDGGTPLRMRNCVVRNIDGDFGEDGGTTGAVWIGGDANFTNLQGGIIEGLLVENVQQQRLAARALSLRDGGSNQLYKGITIRNVRGDPSYWQVTLESIGAGSEVKDVTIENTHFFVGADTWYPILVTALVRHMRLRNLRIEGPTTGTPTNCGLMRADGAVSTLTCDGIAALGKVYSIGRFVNTVRFFLSNVFAEDVNHLGWFLLNTGASATVKGCNGMNGAAVEDITKTAGSLASEAINFKVDVNSVTRAANSFCWNTNAARSCGIGPVMCDGTTWKHMITAATF